MTALSQLFQEDPSVTLPAAVEQAMEQHLRYKRELASWIAFEQSAAGQEYPEWVAKTFISILRECEQSGRVPQDLVEHALEHCKEWFSSNPEEQACALIELAEIAPEHQAIFDQCTVSLTHAQRWESLLAIHDRRAEAVDSTQRRIVLEQAAQIAQDFGNDADRAMRYYAALLELEPNNDRVFTIFVRLVTRQEAWSLYAETLAKRANHLSPQEAQVALLGRAQLLVEKLDNVSCAIDQYAEILKIDPECETALRAVVRVSQDKEQSLELQCLALERLFNHYRDQSKLDLALTVINNHIARIEPQRNSALEHTRVALLAELERTEELCNRSAELFLGYPQDTHAQRIIRELMTEHRRETSNALIDAFSETQGSASFESADLVLQSASHLAQEQVYQVRVAQTLVRLILDEQVDTSARQDAANLYQNLDETIREQFDSTALLEEQIDLATAEDQRVSLLIRLADRLESEDNGEINYGAWQRVLKLRPNHIQAQDQIETYLRQQQSWDELATHLEHCIAHCEDKERELQMQLKLVDVDLDERELIDQAVDRMRSMFDRFPDTDQVATRYHDTLLLHDRYQEFVDWLVPRAFARRDVRAMIACGNVFFQELSAPQDCAHCVLEALGVRPDFESARELGLSLLRSEPEFDTTALAGALWRSFSTIDIEPEQLDALETVTKAHRDGETQATLWIEAEGRFERGQDQEEARYRCLSQALHCSPINPRLPRAFRSLTNDAPEFAGHAFLDIMATVQDQKLEAEQAASLFDLAAQLGAFSQDDSVGAKQIVDARLRSWRAHSNPTRHLEALHGAIECEDWDAVVELTIGASQHGAALEPGHLWSKVCQQTHPSPEAIPLALIEKFAEFFSQDPGTFDRSRNEWVWQLASLLAHHQEFLRARQLALPLAYQTELAVEDSRLRTLFAWLRMEPMRKKEALDVAELLVDRLSLSVEERRVHAALDRELRDPGKLSLQLAAWESCEQVVFNRAAENQSPPAPVLDTMYECLAAYIEIARAQGQNAAAVTMAKRALELPVPRPVHERIFAQCWASLNYPREVDAQLHINPEVRDILSLLEIDRARLLTFNVGYQDEDTLWRGKMLTALLGFQRRYFEQSEVLVERLERAEAQGPPNTPKQLMELRLAISSTLRSLSRDDGQLDFLLANLNAVAAHPESLKQAATLLEERGDHERLAQLWSEQAIALVEHHDGDRKIVNPRAAELWRKAANCYKTQLKQPQRAVEALEQARKLVSCPEVLDELVDLYLQEPCLDLSRAAAHLHRRLDVSNSQERLSLTYRLADLYLQIHQARQSQSVIDEVFDQAAPVIEFRRLYLRAIDSMRDSQQMLSARVRLSEFFSDQELDLATRTCAQLLSRLDAHEIDIRELLPLLEKSAPKKPNDLILQKHYVTALSATGRREDAVAHLNALIEAQGRRRSPQRACLHALLGDQYALSKDLQRAAHQFEQAALMDSSQAQRWIDVARLHEQLRDTASAERALRTLLIHAQKRQSGDIRTPTAAWVMLQMYLLNENAENHQVAQRHWESCRDRCMQNVHAAREVLCELAREESQHNRYLELADRLLDEDLAHDFKAEILAQRAEHLEEAGDTNAAFEMILAAISHDPTPASYSATALRLANTPHRQRAFEEHLDRILNRETERDADETNAEPNATLRSQKIMALCGKARLCALHSERYSEVEEYLQQAQALESRPIELLRTQHDVAYQMGNTEMLRNSLEAMHRQNVLPEPTLGDSWLARAEQYATRSQNYRLALRAIDEALSSGVSRRRALDVLLAFPRFDNDTARNGVLDVMQSIAEELSDKQAILKVLQERLETRIITTEQLQQFYRLAKQEDCSALASQALEHALSAFEDTPNELQHWAVWAYLEEQLKEETCKEDERERIWNCLGHCSQQCEETTMRGPVTAVLEKKWFPKDPTTCILTLEALLENVATYEPYRSALWELYHSTGDIKSLLDITQRNLALLEDASTRADVRIRFVEAIWDSPESNEYRIEMLRETLTEDSSHAKAQSLLIEHYRENGELDELESLLSSRLQSARACKDIAAQNQIGLSLAKINYDKDPVQGINFCHQLFNESEQAQVEVSQACVEWLTQESGRELFARAFGYQELGTDETWGYYQNFLFERYQELIEHGNAEQLKASTLAAGRMLSSAHRVDDAMRLLLDYRRDHLDCLDTEAALIELYESHGRYQELVDLLLHQAHSMDQKDHRVTRILKAAKIIHEELEDSRRALALIATIEVEPQSQAHYELLMTKIEYLGEDDAEAMLAQIHSALPNLNVQSDFDVDAMEREELLEAIGHVELQAKKAATLVELGRHEEAMHLYRILASVDPESYRAAWARCQSARLDALIESDDQDEAKHTWVASAKGFLDQEDQDQEESGTRLCDLGRRLATQGLRDGEFLQSLSAIASRCEDEELITNCKEWALESDDSEVAIQALAYLVNAAIDDEDYDRAQKYLQQCESSLSDQTEYLEQRKRLLHLQENYHELARLEYDHANAQEDDQKACEAFKHAAQWFEKAEDSDNYRLCLEQAAKRGPDDYSVFVRLVDLDLERQDTGSASERLDQALAAIPKEKEQAGLIAQLCFKKSQLLGTSDEPAAQLEWLQKAHNTNRNDVEITSALADLAQEREEWELASRALRQLSTIGEEGGAPPAHDLCVRQAKLWQSAKDFRKASFWAHKARHADPGSEEIRNLLEELAAQQREA